MVERDQYAAHLYDAVVVNPVREGTPTIEYTRCNRRPLAPLPEEPLIRGEYHGQSSGAGAFSGLSVGYDISHRHPEEHGVTPEPVYDEPNLVSMYPYKEKPWISERRESADDMLRRIGPNPPLIDKTKVGDATPVIMKRFEQYLGILDEFLEGCDRRFPVRSRFLRRIAECYRDIAAFFPRYEEQFQKEFDEKDGVKRGLMSEVQRLEDDVSAGLVAIERLTKTLESLRGQAAGLRSRREAAEARFREAEAEESQLQRIFSRREGALADLQSEIEKRQTQIAKRRREKAMMEEEAERKVAELAQEKKRTQETLADLRVVAGKRAELEAQLESR